MSKTIYVKYLVNGKDYEVIVYDNEKVIDLKKKIERLLGVTLVNKLMIKHCGKRKQQSLSDENITISEARVKSNDVITIGKSDVKGGNAFCKIYYTNL